MTLLDAFVILFLLGLVDLRYLFVAPGLWKADALLFLTYLLKFPPYFIYRDRAGLPYAAPNFYYGETPYLTADAVRRIARIGPDDVVYDLGCGRGKLLFYMRCAAGCRCEGFDLLRTYVRTASWIGRLLRIEGVRFHLQDFLSVSLDEASVVYVHGSFFTADVKAGLHRKIETMRAGARWISVSVPCSHPRLEPYCTERLFFSWGREPVYFYTVR